MMSIGLRPFAVSRYRAVAW